MARERLAEAEKPEGPPAAVQEAPPACDLSIVIVVYQTPDLLRRCLDFLEAAGIAVSWEAIVIDNAPQVGDCAGVAAGRPRVRYVPNPHNVGFGRGCNQGIRLARGRNYLLLNPDVEVRPGSCKVLLDYLKQNADVGIVAPRLHYADGRLQESCRTFYTLPIFLLRRTFLGRLFPNARLVREHLMLDWDHEDTRTVDWCLGACMLVRREAAEDVGLMDERFFMYFEDVDWCYRMRQRGWKVVYHPASRMIHHYQRSSAGWKPSRGLLIHLGSTLRYYEKWSFLLYWLKLRSRQLRRAALFVSDLIMVVVSFLCAYALRSLASGLLTKPLFGLELYGRFLLFTAGVAMGSFLVFGLYRERLGPSLIENGLPVFRALAWTSMLMMASTFLFSVRFYSRVVVLLFFPLAVVLVTAGRVVFLRALESMRRKDLNLRRVGVLGPSQAVEDLMDRFRLRGRFGMEPVLLAQPAGEPLSPAVWIGRLRSERVQELILFEEWTGDIPGLLQELREQRMMVRVIPRLRDVLPAESRIDDFMGWPALTVPVEGKAVLRTPGRSAGSVLAMLGLGLVGLIPYLGVTAVRRLLGRPRVERVRIRGQSGRVFEARRLAGPSGRVEARRPAGPSGPGFWRTLVAWYPGLPTLGSGRLNLIGVYPFTEEEWSRLSDAYRAGPPAVAPGIFGPWVSRRMDLGELERWSRAYPERWSAAEDFRIFWRAVLGLMEPS